MYCGLNGNPVSCRANENTIIENAYAKGFAAAKAPSMRTGKKVAVIGSGPSGLAAADQLNKRGHNVTVFERADRVGGLLMYGIPNMKLEKHIIDRKINIMKEEGVEFVTGKDIGKNQDLYDVTVTFNGNKIEIRNGENDPLISYEETMKLQKEQEKKAKEEAMKKIEKMSAPTIALVKDITKDSDIENGYASTPAKPQAPITEEQNAQVNHG